MNHVLTTSNAVGQTMQEIVQKYDTKHYVCVKMSIWISRENVSKVFFLFTNCHYFFRFKEKNNKDIYKHLLFFLLSSLKVKEIEVDITLKVKKPF